MVSTYLSYDLVIRDMKTTLSRVSQKQQVARDAAYYKENIGKVKTVEDFVKNDRLYQYAMTAYGLEDMIYAKAFMKQVLESDLSDADSYANRLTDTRYKDFAAAFSFTGNGVPAAQSTTQTDELIGLYSATIDTTSDSIKEETRYYNVMMSGIVTSVDQVLNNDRLRAYVFTTFGIDENSWNRETIRGLMSSDLNDSGSYINTVWGPKLADYTDLRNAAVLEANTAATQITDLKAQLTQPGADVDAINAQIAQQQAIVDRRAPQITSYENSIAAIGKYYDMAAAFEFAADGTLATGQAAQTSDLLKLTNQQYILSNPRKTPAAALLDKEYFEQKVASATTVDELFADPQDTRMLEIIKTTFGLTSAIIMPSTIENILTSDRDPDNPNSYINMAGANKAKYKALMEAFNFKQDGTLDAGVPAQTAEQTLMSTNYYMAAYNDKDDAADEKAITQFKKDVALVTTVAEFIADADVYKFALKAVGLDPDKVSTLTIKNVLKSDLTDPKSYVYKLKDPRYVELAKAFNFDSKGSITEPLSAQSSTAVTQIAKDYIIQKTRFADSKEKTALRETADKEAQYYQDNIGKIDNVSELLADRKIVDVVLFAKGLDPETVTDDYLKKIFASDLTDPKSFANTEQDERFAEVAASFNFDTNGNLSRETEVGAQQRGQILETSNKYLHQMLETEQGENNAGVRLALYFERKTSDITSAYDILGDTALLEVFRTAFSLPAELSSMDIDQQAKIVEKYMDLQDLKDPEKVATFLKRFTVLYDLENSTTQDSAISIMFGSGSSGVSADTLLAISQLRSGG